MFERLKAKKEIKKRNSPLEDFDQKLDHLNRLLKKSELLSPPKRDAIYSKIGDLYKEKAGRGEDVKEVCGPIVKAIESYTQSGEIRKARRLLNKTYRVGNSILSRSIISWHFEAAGDIIGEEKTKKLEYEIERESRRRKGKSETRRLGRYFPPTTAIIGLIGGLFFLSTNMTGNVIGLNQSTGNILGAVLLCVGLVGSLFWFRIRKR